MNSPTRLCILGVSLLLAFAPPSAAAAPTRKAPDRGAWFQDARFGMFIHFGVYSSVARGEWVRNVEKISDEDYQPAFENWNPHAYDPRAWAKMAKAAGMKYAVMTAKHHEGFALWDTKVSDFKATRTPIGRDLVREFLDAFRAEGLRVGLYFSLIDWHHPDYPHFGDKHHPMRDNAAWKDRPHDFSRYLTFMHAQIKELVTRYGKLDVMWFDFSYDQMRGEKWRAAELVKLVRGAQPGILLNNRLGGDGETRGMSYGDFETPEQQIPEQRPLDQAGKPVTWETCLTINGAWGFNRKDQMWKSATQLVTSLADVVSKGGNLLLNVGPDGNGRIPEPTVKVLGEMGQWMNRNAAAIVGAGAANHPALGQRPIWGRYTQRGKTIFAHVFPDTIGPVRIPIPRAAVKTVRLLSDGGDLRVNHESDQGFSIDLRQIAPALDPINTVIKLDLK